MSDAPRHGPQRSAARPHDLIDSSRGAVISQRHSRKSIRNTGDSGGGGGRGGREEDERKRGKKERKKMDGRKEGAGKEGREVDGRVRGRRKPWYEAK